MCRLPMLLHEGECTRQKEDAVLKYKKIVDERDKFGERMKYIIKCIREQKEKEVRKKSKKI